MLPSRDPPQIERHTKTESEDGKRYFMQMEKKKKAGKAVLTSNKIDFKTTAIITDKEGYYLMIKGIIQQEDLTLVNIYTPNIRAPPYVKQVFFFF